MQWDPADLAHALFSYISSLQQEINEMLTRRRGRVVLPLIDNNQPKRCVTKGHTSAKSAKVLCCLRNFILEEFNDNPIIVVNNDAG